MTPPCPRPDKGRYATETAALRVARLRAGVAGRPLTSYWCSCGWWHLTSQLRPRTGWQLGRAGSAAS